MTRGGSRPKLKGGQLGKGAQKTQRKVSEEAARKTFWVFIGENSLVFLLNNALVDMFPYIQNETLKKRVHLGQNKERCSCKRGTAKA